jgi:hypothetical protein
MARGERGKPARRTGALGFRDKRCKLRNGAGEGDRPEANQIRREVAQAAERIVREPGYRACPRPTAARAKSSCNSMAASTR